jgi:hypothetical protein
MTPLIRALMIAAQEAQAASERSAEGMEKVRLRRLSGVLLAEARTLAPMRLVSVGGRFKYEAVTA